MVVVSIKFWKYPNIGGCSTTNFSPSAIIFDSPYLFFLRRTASTTTMITKPTKATHTTLIATTFVNSGIAVEATNKFEKRHDTLLYAYGVTQICGPVPRFMSLIKLVIQYIMMTSIIPSLFQRFFHMAVAFPVDYGRCNLHIVRRDGCDNIYNMAVLESVKRLWYFQEFIQLNNVSSRINKVLWICIAKKSVKIEVISH